MSDTLAGETAAPAGVPDPTAAPLGGGMRGVARSAWFGLWAQAVDKLTPVALDLQQQLILGGVELVVHQIAHRMAIDRSQEITGLDASQIGGTAGRHLAHPSIQFWHDVMCISVYLAGST